MSNWTITLDNPGPMQHPAPGRPATGHVDVRVIAVISGDSASEIASGRLRVDLFHRVAAHFVRLPALSERRFDLPGLFMHFLNELLNEHPAAAWLFGGSQDWRRTIPLPFFIDLLRSSFAGNVRELRHLFGLVGRIEERPLASAEGVRVGTLAYMSPEQCRGEPATPASELYAFGCMMFEWLTGQLPFTGTPAQLIHPAQLLLLSPRQHGAPRCDPGAGFGLGLKKARRVVGVAV